MPVPLMAWRMSQGCLTRTAHLDLEWFFLCLVLCSSHPRTVGDNGISFTNSFIISDAGDGLPQIDPNCLHVDRTSGRNKETSPQQ